jgi:hypothetical protein
MSKQTNRLLILALLSVFAAASAGSAVAAEKRDGKNDSKTQSRESKDHHDDHHDKDHSGRDGDAVPPAARTSVVTVTNRGAGPLTITAPPAITKLKGNGSFAIVPPGTGTPCATSLVVTPRGGKCTIGVEYMPTDGEESTARLTLTDSGAATATQETVIKSD